jgi:hypothetical protein
MLSLAATWKLLKCASNQALMQTRSLYDAPLKYSFDPSLQDYKIPDYDCKTLQSISKSRFGVNYLGIAEKPPTFPVYGLIMGNERMLINLCCSVPESLVTRATVDEISTNVLFILNTCSPTTFLSKQAMEKMYDYPEFLPIRPSLRIQTSDQVVSVYRAPQGSQFTELNILGMDFLKCHKLTTIIDSDNNAFMLDISFPTNRVPNIDKLS